MRFRGRVLQPVDRSQQHYSPRPCRHFCRHRGESYCVHGGRVVSPATLVTCIYFSLRRSETESTSTHSMFLFCLAGVCALLLLLFHGWYVCVGTLFRPTSSFLLVRSYLMFGIIFTDSFPNPFPAPMRRHSRT